MTLRPPVHVFLYMGMCLPRCQTERSSYDDFDGDFVAPSGMLVRIFPRLNAVYLENVLALLVDLHAVSSNGAAEDYSHEVLLDGALFEIGDVDA